ASGVHKKTGKRGFVGKMLTTVDYLSGKAKKEYMKSGDLKVKNVHDTVLSFDELMTYAPENQKSLLNEWRDSYTQRDILRGLGVNKNIYYKKLYDLDILPKPESVKKQEQKAREKKTDAELSYNSFVVRVDAKK